MLDQESLSQTTFYANTLNKNLRVSIGRYGADIGGWKLKYTVLCDGIEIVNGDGIIKYDDLEKIMPSGMDKYDAIDMYGSLFKCGEPVLTFQIAYKVSEEKDKVSTYGYESDYLYAYDTKKISVDSNGIVDGVKINIGSSFLFPKKIEPGNDWLYLKTNSSNLIKNTNKSELSERIKEEIERQELVSTINSSLMVQILNKNYMVGKTEVTQKLYQFVMGDNPSNFKGDNLPVERVSWYDCIYFCNKLSEILGYTPVYSVNGETNVEKWDYIPHKGNSIEGIITQNVSADGFRLPTETEWRYAANGGENYRYSGSDDLDSVGWDKENSGRKTHEVGQKKSNGYGLFDMSGNVAEWCFDSSYDGTRYGCGGSWIYCEVSSMNNYNAFSRYDNLGFRLFRTSK